MTVVPFIPAHLEGLKIHDYMSFMGKSLTKEYGEHLANFPSYSYIRDGKVIGCSGVVPLGVYRYQAWALLSYDSGKYMRGITREVKSFLDMFSGRRVETHVVDKFPQGSKWMEMLGFKKETPSPMRMFGDDGKDYYLYARVK